MSLESIKDQAFAVDLCRKWLKRQTTHPLLFYGPPGAGKRALAIEVAKALNCATGSLDGCDECLSCRKIAAGNHPDVRVLDLAWQAAERKEAIEKQQNLRLETVMTERHRLLQSAGEGSWKVSILDDAHRLTADAANVLLKVLEEPPTHTAIILVTPFRDRLFATIVSRCQPVRFRFIDRSAHLSHENIEAHRQAEVLWEALGKERPARLIQAAEGRTRTSKFGRNDIEQQIQSLLVPAARAMRAGDRKAREPVRLLQKALAQLRQNVQPALVYDNLLVHLASARQSVKP